MKIVSVFISFIVVVLLCNVAFAQDKKEEKKKDDGIGFYLNANGGVSWQEDSDYEDDVIEMEAEFDTGFVLGGALGYDFGAIRTEAEFGYREHDFDKLNDITFDDQNFGSFSASGDVTTLSYMFNTYLDFENKSSITPYIGGGLGFANIDVDDLAVEGGEQGSDDDTVFAYQVGAGIGYDITKKITFDVGYRHFRTDDPDLDGGDAEYKTHNLLFGLRFKY